MLLINDRKITHYRKLMAFMLLIFSSVTAFAQIQNHASWATKFSKTEVKIGETVDIHFTATIDPGWYLYSSDIDPDLGPMVTTITFEKSPAFELVGKLKPVNPKKKFDEIWNGNITYFTGKAEFIQTIKILQENPLIKAEAEYQTCTEKDGLCVLGNASFDLKGLKILPSSIETKKEETALVQEAGITAIDTISTKVEELPIAIDTASATTTIESSSLTSSTTTPTNTDHSSLWGFALAAFLSGLVALLTPCVFPIIPVTVSYFTKQEGGQRKALLYGLSIVLIYTLIGFVLSRFNGPAFANFLSTHWIPNLLFFAIFIFFALSFLGLFEIVLPHSLINKMDAKADQGGLLGIFFMAFTLVLVSFSCTGPIVGSLLVASAGGEVVKPIIGMASFASAFAIPFTLFALFPHWLKSLPKSGGWLNTVKVVLGFIELALALKFLSIADQVYHWGILDREIFLAFWIVIFTMLGFYFLGKITTPHDSAIERVSVPRILLAIITFTFVVYMIPGMWGAPLKALAGYLPPQSTHDFDLQKTTTSTRSANSLSETPKYSDLFTLPHGLQGFFDYQQGIQYARKVNKPVFIDFTGHGCVNCREMEARVWSDPAVLQRLQEDYVIIALYVDDKKELPEKDWYTSTYDNKVKKTIGAQNADLQIVKYNNNAQPHYCLVDHQGELLVSPINYDLNASNFAAFLDSGKSAFQNKK